MKLSDFKVDRTQFEEPVWLEVPKLGDLKVCLVPALSQIGTKVRNEFIEKIGEADDPALADNMTADQQEELGKAVLCACWVDWKNMIGDNNRPIKCTPERVKEIVNNPDYLLVLGEVMLAFSDLNQRILKSHSKLVDALGNSPDSSNTSTNGRTKRKTSSRSQKRSQTRQSRRKS